MSRAGKKPAEGAPSAEKMSAAYYESVHLRCAKSRGRKRRLATASQLRDEILKGLGPIVDSTYDAAALDLVDEHELALREAWELRELCDIRARADAAIAAALGLPPQFRMPL